MQPPSFGAWVNGVVLVLIAAALSLRGAKVIGTKLAIIVICSALAMGFVGYLIQRREYGAYIRKEEEKARAKKLEAKKAAEQTYATIRSHEANLVFTPGESQIAQNLGLYCFLAIRNLSARKVRVTSLWLEGCRADGGDLYLQDAALDRYLDVGEEYVAKIPKNIVHREDWFDKGRAHLSDGSTIRSMQDKEVPQYGNLGPGNLIVPADPRSPQSPKRDP